MQQEWWYVSGHDKVGPASLGEMQELVSRGELSNSHLVWKPGLANWMKLGDTELRAPTRDVAHELLNNRDWWYAISGERYGPCSYEDLKELIARGRLKANHLVWKQGLHHWVPIAVVDDLAAAVKAAAAPQDEVADESQAELFHAGPARRFWARFIDGSLIGLPTSFFLAFWAAYYSPDIAMLLARPGGETAFGLLMVPVYLFLESLIFGVFGSTPGKALLGLSLTTQDGKPLDFGQYWQRQFSVYFSGLGMGLPLISLFTLIRQYLRVKRDQCTSYDAGLRNVESKPIGFVRSLIAFVVICAFIALHLMIQMATAGV